MLIKADCGGDWDQMLDQHWGVFIAGWIDEEEEEEEEGRDGVIAGLAIADTRDHPVMQERGRFIGWQRVLYNQGIDPSSALSLLSIAPQCHQLDGITVDASLVVDK